MPRSFDRHLPDLDPGASAINAVPPAIVLIVLALGLVEIALGLGSAGYAGGAGAVGWRIQAIERLAMSPAAWDYIRDRGLSDPWMVARLVTYPLVHWGPIHALFAGAMLLALGKFVAEAMGQGRALLVLLVATVAGGVAHGVALSGTYPLIGAYPGIYGLIGAYTYLLWVNIGRVGGNRLGAFRMIGVLLGLQLAFGAIQGANPAWLSEVAGFFGGGLAAILVAPGSFGALRQKLQAR